MGPDGETSGRRRRRLVTGLVLLAVVSPALRDRDSFPLSTYPMYASTRPETVTFPTVAGFDADGRRTGLSLQAVARTDDALIAQARVARSIEAGSAGDLCTEVAGRVADHIARVEIVIERHDVVDLASGRDSLVSRDVQASCEAAR